MRYGSACRIRSRADDDTSAFSIWQHTALILKQQVHLIVNTLCDDCLQGVRSPTNSGPSCANLNHDLFKGSNDEMRASIRGHDSFEHQKA